jgi:hypothetical protein
MVAKRKKTRRADKKVKSLPTRSLNASRAKAVKGGAVTRWGDIELKRG